jgi:hypothetical protein
MLGLGRDVNDLVLWLLNNEDDDDDDEDAVESSALSGTMDPSCFNDMGFRLLAEPSSVKEEAATVVVDSTTAGLGSSAITDWLDANSTVGCDSFSSVPLGCSCCLNGSSTSLLS